MKKTLSLIQLQHASLFLGAACAMSHTWAQASDPAPKTYPLVEVVEKPLEYRQFEKVEITGSSIVRKEQTKALPVQLITREDIRRSGASNMVDVLHKLTHHVHGGQQRRHDHDHRRLHHGLLARLARRNAAFAQWQTAVLLWSPKCVRCGPAQCGHQHRAFVGH
jgi:hypothetical protein